MLEEIIVWCWNVELDNDNMVFHLNLEMFRFDSLDHDCNSMFDFGKKNKKIYLNYFHLHSILERMQAYAPCLIGMETVVSPYVGSWGKW